MLSHKFRNKFEVWIIPIVNPDGVVCGNYRNNLQGKDMNRHFFADDDPEGYRNRALEVEIIRSQIKQKFPPGETKNFKMFLDIHAHSCAKSIFIYAPQPEKESEQDYIRQLP
jgi:murein tripeptide amidase MpaA